MVVAMAVEAMVEAMVAGDSGGGDGGGCLRAAGPHALYTRSAACGCLSDRACNCAMSPFIERFHLGGRDGRFFSFLSGLSFSRGCVFEEEFTSLKTT